MKVMGWFLLGAALALVVTCLSCAGDDDSESAGGDDDASSSWTCEEAVGAYVDECCGGAYDCEMWRAESVDNCGHLRDEQRQLISECYFEYWPDCSAISANCSATDFSDG